jgi:serine phosphatase RsbU (regulator of sigma subunit)
VSGRGVEAATVMAKIHFAIRAYALQGDAPEEILAKLGKLIDCDNEGFVTVLCASIEVNRREVALVSAGHPPPLLINGPSTGFLRTEVFPPIGVRSAPEFSTSRFEVPAGGTILAFTDGLVERRGESIDVGLERLRNAVDSPATSLDQLLDEVVEGAFPSGPDDDTAILALRWSD